MLLFLLLLWSSASATDEAVSALQDLGRSRHPCVSRLPALDTALAGQPTPALRLERALCLHAVGRYDQALDALDTAVPAGALATEAQQEGATVQVVLFAWKGRRAEADKALSSLQARLPAGHARLTRAQLLVQAGRGDVAGAWTAAEASWRANPDTPQLATALAELTALAPNDAPSWAREVLGRESQVLLQTNRAVGLLTSGDMAGCTALVAETLPRATASADQRRLHILGHRCSAAGGDLAAANTHMMATGDLSVLDAQAVLAHADLLADLGKHRHAVRLVELARLEEGRGRDTRLLRWKLALGDLEGARAVGLEGKASPESRAALGLALHKAGQHTRAVSVLEAACPALGRRARADCEAVEGRAHAAARTEGGKQPTETIAGP